MNKAGRPKTGQMAQFSCRIDKELDKAISAYCKKHSGKKADFQRLIVKSGFEHLTQGRG